MITAILTIFVLTVAIALLCLCLLAHKNQIDRLHLQISGHRKTLMDRAMRIVELKNTIQQLNYVNERLERDLATSHKLMERFNPSVPGLQGFGSAPSQHITTPLQKKEIS
ncbi:MAG TPA: hypothetical protein P5533_00570 [Candidatus Cloacimonadota bacterium]|nr:hypothetical protein [Candidatus Cloacimonadota bacterium]